MNYTFECKTCGACGCGVNLYNDKGDHITKSVFMKNPESLFCKTHIPKFVKLSEPKVTVKVS